MQPVYKRVLLKLSGEALMGEQQFGIDPAVANRIAADIGEIQQLGPEWSLFCRDVDGMELEVCAPAGV